MEKTVQSLAQSLAQGHFAAIARALTWVENGSELADDLLRQIHINTQIPVLGITGPPGAGKSTLVNALLNECIAKNQRVAVLAIDPSSPFSKGALLGDRIRMSRHFNHPNVFIRSVASRGALGGLAAKVIEMCDLLKSARFDVVMIETVGVGQSEVEVAALSSKTLVVLVPEAGDEVQQLKSGLMEIADAFALNKADREGAAKFANSLQKTLKDQHKEVPVFQTVADKQQGIAPLYVWLMQPKANDNKQTAELLAEQAYRLIQHQRMQGVDKDILLKQLSEALERPNFNIYRFIANWV